MNPLWKLERKKIKRTNKSLLRGISYNVLTPFFVKSIIVKKYRNLIIILLSILLPGGMLLLFFLKKKKDDDTITGQKITMDANIKPKNNPLNIRSTPTKWVGETTQKDNVGFEQFDSIENGLRAALINIRTYLKRGINTPKTIISTWAPASENPTANYVKFVCDKGGLKPDQKITFSNSDMQKLVIPMSRFEQGKDVVTVEMFNKVFGRLNG